MGSSVPTKVGLVGGQRKTVYEIPSGAPAFAERNGTIVLRIREQPSSSIARILFR